MRKLKLEVQMSVDGFISGPNGEMDWLTFDWDDALKECVTEITTPIDCIVLGRKLAQGFIPHWGCGGCESDDPEYTAGRKFTDTHKVVFTKTLVQSEWDNTALAKGDLVDEISVLKEQDGNDIIAYGDGTFVSDLIRHGLIDELNLFVYPVALAWGCPYSEIWRAGRSSCSKRSEPFHAALFSSGTAKQPDEHIRRKACGRR